MATWLLLPATLFQPSSTKSTFTRRFGFQLLQSLDQRNSRLKFGIKTKHIKKLKFSVFIKRLVLIEKEENSDLKSSENIESIGDGYTN